MSKKLTHVFFKICKYNFYSIWKGDQQNIGPGFFWRFVSILFLIFKEGDQQKMGQVFSRFVSTIFLVFEKVISKKLGRLF